MGFWKKIKNMLTPSEKNEKEPARTTSQASAASGGNRVVGKSIVKTPAANTAGKNNETDTKKNSTKTAKNETKKSTDSRRTVATGKTAVKLPTQQQKKDAKSPVLDAWNKRRETVEQKQVQNRQPARVSNSGISDKWNSRQKERNKVWQAEEQAKKNRENQLNMLGSAAQTYEAQLKALKGKAERTPEKMTQADVDQYNALWERYQQTLNNYNNAAAAQEAENQQRTVRKKQAKQQILEAMGLDGSIADAPRPANTTPFDVDPQQVLSDSQKASTGAQTAARQRAEWLSKTLPAVGTAGVAAAQDTVGNLMGLGEQAAWALSPGAQKDAASRADHERQVQAWKQERANAQEKLDKAFALTENDALGQFLVELNYNFVQQGAATVAGGMIGKAGGAVLGAAGRNAAAAGENLAGRIGSKAAQRAAAAAKMNGKALNGAARYLQKNASLATMSTLAGSTNYQAAIEGGASNEQAMAYAVLTGAAEAVTEKLFGGNPLMDNEAGWVNRALYKMLGDKKFLKALDSVPVETFNEGFEEVIANYLYSAAQAATGQKVELPSAEENLHSFALGAAMGGMGQAAKLTGNAMRQRSADIETGAQLRRMGAENELIATGLALPGSRAERHAQELQMRNSLPTARELGRQYRENIKGQSLLTAKQIKTEETVRRMATDVGAQVAFDDTIRDAAGNEGAANGYYKDGVLHISRDADKPAIAVAKHEITHYLQQAAPEEYRAFRDYAMRMQGEGAVQAMQERYARGGVTLTEEEAMDEIAANTTEKLLTDRGSIQSLIRENPTMAQRFFDALREFIRKLTGRVDPQLRQAEKLWTEAYRTAGSSKNAAQSSGKAQFSIKETETGQYYVKADRQVLKGDDPKKWGAQLQNFINENIRKGKDLVLPTTDGGLVRLTERSAYKLADNKSTSLKTHKKKELTTEQYRVKETAGVHIDEIILVGKFRKYMEDIDRYHENDVGEDGFNTYTAYFEDFDGKYYEVRFTTALNEDVETAYSIGKMRERKKPTSGQGSSTLESGAQKTGRLSTATIAQQEGESKKKFALNGSEETAYSIEDIQKRKKPVTGNGSSALESGALNGNRLSTDTIAQPEEESKKQFALKEDDANGEKILYDIDPIKKAGRSVKSDAIPVKDIIRNGESDVNKQFSLKEREQFRTDIQAWHRAGQPKGEVFTLGSTGPTLQGLGAIESDIYMSGDKISTILEQHPEMGIREIQRIPEVLEDPTLILKSKGTGKGGNNSRMVLYGSIKARNGQPVLAVLDLRPHENGFLLDDMQKVNSAYTKNNAASFVSDSDVMYVDKKRTVPLLRQFGLTIASRQLLRNGSMGSISYVGNNVKLKGVPFSSVVKLEGESEKKFSLKDSGTDLKTMRAERSDVRREIDKLEWLEEKQGYLDETDAADMKRLRTREKDLTERIDAANATARENRGAAAERIMQKAKTEAAEAQPTQARKTLRQDLLDTFSVQAGRRKELGQEIDQVAERVRERGYATASDGAELFRGLYNAGVVVDTTESKHYAEIRRTLRGVKLHIDETVRAELGDNFAELRQQAARNGIILTTKDGEGVGIDVEHAEMANLFPGVFDSYNTDRTAQLEDMIHAAELGRPEHISLMEQAMRAGGEDAVAQQMTFFDRYLTNALENYAKQAGFEVRVKQGEIMKAAKARAIAAEAWEKQSQRKALAAAQNRTLKVFQRLRRMRKDQSAETKALIDEIVGAFDTMAKTLRKDKEATWRDLRKIYDAERVNDPNFLPNESWEQKFSRLDAARVGELSREEALELYQRGTELIHMIRTKDKEIAAENARRLEDLYRNSVHEIQTSDGDKWKFNRKGEAKKKLSSNRFVRKYWDGEQLSPMNMIEKMGGWRRDGAFYSMAKQLERGEYDKQRYIIQSDALLKDFTEKHEKWIAKADGKGKDAIWYEIKAPAFLEKGNGDADLLDDKTVKIYMTPMMKVKLYLDSLNYDNLRHIKIGGATFPDKRIYSAAKTEADEREAYANGVTVKMQPGFVKSIVANLTPEEKELAFILGTKYFNGYAKQEINRVSNLLDGHDKAMSNSYSPIYTNANYLGKNADPAIVDATIEGMGPMKNRVRSGNPTLAVSALSAFQKHRDMTAKYVGLAIPVRNMNALLNYTEKGYSDSMYAVIGKKWGDEAVQYLKDLMKNIQNKPANELNFAETLVKWVTNNYVKAVFGFNPGTVIKQAPGFFMAGARLGFDTMPATSMLHSAWGKYRDLMAKYTPLMEWRARGYSTREMSDLKDNPNWAKKNKYFKFVFGGAIQWMDLHTCAAIWPWAENYVKKHYPNLRPGSRSEVNSGQDAYYKKVAEVFEDAIANSQPMYDDMHTAKILHSNNGIARGITMFHTAQLTQANAIRQAHGEMKRAKAENDKEGLKRGQKAFKDSIMALLISTLSFEAVGALVAIAKRKDKSLRDDDGKMTPATIAKYMADATAKDLLGNIVGWDTAYDIGTHVLFGNTWYGFEMPGADAIQDFIDDAAKWSQAMAEFMGSIFDMDNVGDFQYYLRTAGGDFRKASKNVAVDLSYLLGVPAKNMESYTLGLMGWINPDLAAAYNNAWGGSYGKSSVAALSGKPKEQAAAIQKAVHNRAKDASDEAVAELQRLYQTEGAEVLPQAVADTITIETGEDSSEKVKLSLKQKSDYQKAYDKVVSAELNQLIASPEYAKLSDDQKAGAVVLLYKYAAEQGKQAAVAEYTPKGWQAKAARAAKEGADVYQTVLYKAATAEIEGDTGEDGDTIAGSKNKKLFDVLDAMNFTATQKAAIYKVNVDDFTEDKEYANAKAAGVNDWQYASFKANTGVMKSDKDDNGKTITGSKKAKVMDYIDGLDISDGAKDAIYYAAGYTESKISEAPWHGGTTGKKSSRKGRKKSSSKKAAKAAKKQAAAREALNSPAVQNYLRKYGGGDLPKAGETGRTGSLPTAADLSAIRNYLNKYGGGSGTTAIQKYLEKYGRG